VLLFPLDTVVDFCRLDRPDGNGFAPQPLLAVSPSRVFQNLFSVVIGEMNRMRPNHSMKGTQHFVVSFGSMRTLIFKVLGDLPQLLLENSWVQASLSP
jgi:hypothetical protein